MAGTAPAQQPRGPGNGEGGNAEIRPEGESGASSRKNLSVPCISDRFNNRCCSLATSATTERPKALVPWCDSHFDISITF